MSKNFSEDRMENRVPRAINSLMKQAKQERANQVTPDGYLPLPVLSADPPVTKLGQYGLYYNSSTGKVRKSYNAGAWVDTTI